MRAILLVVFGLITGCGGAPPRPEVSALRDADPADFFAPVGRWKEGRYTLVYVPVELRGEGGVLGKTPGRDRFEALVAEDRRFLFGREGPLKGLGDRVNLVIARSPAEITLDAAARKALDTGGKASEAAPVWAYHEWLTAFVEAHPRWFGEDPQAVYQIPFPVRDQATWFRFDRVVSLADATVSGWSQKDWRAFLRLAERETHAAGDPAAALERVLRGAVGMTGVEKIVDTAFPKLRVPLVWHGVAGESPGVELGVWEDAGAPRSSVVLFHELGHIAECRASDEYAEQSLNEFLAENPREAAVIRYLGQTLGAKDLARAAETKLAALPFGAALAQPVASLLSALPDGRINVSRLLLTNRVSRRAVGKVYGQPNVLPDDPRMIRETWGRLPGFQEALWDGEGDPKPGAVRMVSGGLYLQDQAFKRLQVYDGRVWRNTYMGDSRTADAPLGPAMEACLGKLAERIERQAR